MTTGASGTAAAVFKEILEEILERGAGRNLRRLSGSFILTGALRPARTRPVGGFNPLRGRDVDHRVDDSFGHIGNLVGPALRQRLEALVDSVNRQILHYAWVETSLDGHLAARTTVNWGGDLRTLWQSGLLEAHVDAHRRSLELALASRLANLKTILTVSQIAGKIALAVTTPLGPLQAISLAWQFVHDVIMPLMEPNQ